MVAGTPSGRILRRVTALAGPKQLRRLLDAVMSVGSDLSLPLVLERIVHAAADLVEARYGALGVLDPTGTRLTEFLTVGIDDEAQTAIGAPPEGLGVLGLLIVDPKPLRIPDLRVHPRAHGFPSGHPQMRSFLGVPIVIRDRVFVNLYLTDKTDGDAFTDVDEEMAVALASAAAVAIENARLHAQVLELATFEDRERIARDLHDTVIQRLFGIGLALQGATRRSDPDDVEERIQQALDDLDTTVREIRSVIFELHTTRADRGRSLRREVLDLCAEAGRSLGFDPVVRFDGPVDTAVPEEHAEHLLAVLREALSNVARHAQAARATVRVTALNGRLSLEVVDDGVGIPHPPPTGGQGVDNMAVRATMLAGYCELTPADRGGTTLRWEVPLNALARDRAR